MLTSTIELKQLTYFLAVVDFGTFSDAAEMLGVSQPAVSRTVASLEKAVGARLLHRSSRSIALTPIGLNVLARIRGIVADSQSLLKEVERLTEA